MRPRTQRDRPIADEYEEDPRPYEEESEESSPDSPEDAESESVEEPEETVDPGELRALKSQLQGFESKLRESTRHQRQLEEESRLSRERERALLQALEARGNQAPIDPLADVKEALASRGVSEEAAPIIAELARRQADQSAMQAVQSMMAPVLRQWQGQQALEQELGDYPRREVLKYLNENPHVQARYEALMNADPVGAHEYALLKYREQSGYQDERDLKAAHEEVRQMKQEGRTTGRVLSSRGSQGRRAPGSGESEEVIAQRLERLREQAMMAKDPMRYVRERAKLIPSFDRIKWADMDE